jgi:hypothetical protein
MCIAHSCRLAPAAKQSFVWRPHVGERFFSWKPLQLCLHHLPSDRVAPSPPWSIHKPSTAAAGFTWTTPRELPPQDLPRPQLPASVCSSSPHLSLGSALLRAINILPNPVPSVQLPPPRSAGGRCTGRRCYPPSPPPPSGAGRSPSARRRRRRPAGPPADAPSELKVLPRPLTEK